MPGLGRIRQPDERNRLYPIRALVKEEKPRSHSWPCDLWLDQGETPTCVAHAVSHEIAARPVLPQFLISEPWVLGLYAEAQEFDGIVGPHDGTSVLAGMKAATERGFYAEYRWAFDVDDLALAVAWHGPAVIGINWYSNMMDVTRSGYVIPTGSIVGGHAILVRGVHVGKDDHFILRNSWGKSWGRNGEVLISRSDLATLLKQDGDACIPVIREVGPAHGSPQPPVTEITAGTLATPPEDGSPQE